MIKLGTNSIGKMYLGSTEIAKAYLGSTLVYQKAASLYKLVEYVICSGHSAIDTGLTIASTDVIHVDYELTNLSTTGYKYILACQQGYTGGGLWVETYKNSSNNNKWFVRFGSSSSTSGTYSTYTSGKHTIEIKKQSFSLDGSQKLTPNFSSMPSTTLGIGGRISTDGTSVTGFYGYIYDCDIKDSNGNYRFHGVPVVRLADSVAGLLDTVSGNFFRSVATDFTAGPDKTS